MKKPTRKPKPPKLTVSQYKRGHEPETLLRVARELLASAAMMREIAATPGPHPGSTAKVLARADSLRAHGQRFEREARAAGKAHKTKQPRPTGEG